MPLMHDWIVPDWPVAERIGAVITTRSGGVSSSPFDGLNLADHVGDDMAVVARNRAQLTAALGITSEPLWLNQVHGCQVVEVGSDNPGCTADAATANFPGQVCAVLTADCLPLLLCNRDGTRVAAIHAGWRGLAGGVIEATLERFSEPGTDLLAWLGPAIGPEKFEVGDEVRDLFLASNAADAASFRPLRSGKWLADIYQLARNRLQMANLGFVGGGDYCTVSDPERFFSYRRDGVTGRIASLIWIRQL